jgi:hypothetical protein
VVIPIRRITAWERPFLAMVTATTSGSPMVPKPYRSAARPASVA